LIEKDGDVNFRLEEDALMQMVMLVSLDCKSCTNGIRLAPVRILVGEKVTRVGVSVVAIVGSAVGKCVSA